MIILYLMNIILFQIVCFAVIGTLFIYILCCVNTRLQQMQQKKTKVNYKCHKSQKNKHYLVKRRDNIYRDRKRHKERENYRNYY
jgi:hypothetical protein